MTSFSHIGVVGAGAWGLALSNAADAAGRDVTLWGRDAAALSRVAITRQSPSLPGVALGADIRIAPGLSTLDECDALLLVTPAQTTREMTARLAAVMEPRPLVICAKGVEHATHRFLTEVVAEAAPGWDVLVLSGPSFAADVASGLPTAVTVAARDETLAAALAAALKGPALRLYHSGDPRGVEIGGAAKNVLAIACGVAAGLGLGASANAALVARGFAELRRFGEAFGASPATLMGLSGLGDLVLTCSSHQSRNYSFGLALGRGASVESASGGKLVEGAATAGALMALAFERGVDMPIAAAVDALLRGEIDARGAVGGLLARPQRGEG